MIADHMIGKCLLAVFAVVCAWQDIRTMSIRREVVAIGIIGVAAGTMLAVCADPGNIQPGVQPVAESAASLTHGNPAYGDLILGCLPGIALMIVSYVTGQIGIGDGLYFIIVGTALGLKRTLMLMLLALFLNALVSSGMLIWAKFAGAAAEHRDARIRTEEAMKADMTIRTENILKRRLPFLPATGAALIWMLVRC